jgi:hypothetical protein
VLGEQADPVGVVVAQRPAQLLAQHPLRRLQGIAQSGPPRTAAAPPESELEQQLEVLGAGDEHPVVEPLAVVRVGPRLQQQPGQRVPVRVPGLVARALFALAEHAGQDGERRRQPAPQVAGVRVGTGAQQEPGRVQHR